jgi:TPR repeat protein
MLDMEDTGEWSHWAGVVQQIKGTTVLYDIVREHFANEKWTGVPYKTSQEYVKSVVILNCPNPEKLVTGEGAEFFCMKTTNYVNRDGISFVTYDCGTKPTQDELRKWQDEEAERQQAAKKELDERRRIAAENAAAAKKATQAKVVKWNQEQADKGDPTGLLRMGELYRDGNGVPKDLDKAREYLTKASAAGSPDAADELTKLNQVSTNAPANSK